MDRYSTMPAGLQYAPCTRVVYSLNLRGNSMHSQDHIVKENAQHMEGLVQLHNNRPK